MASIKGLASDQTNETPTSFCLFFRVSLESRDLSELLVSAVPPDLLDPLDWLVLLERLAVRYEASLCTM